MAKIDLSKYIDNSLRAEFEAKPYDAEKARKPVVDGIARTLEQFNSKLPSKAPNKWFKANGDVVRFSAKSAKGVIPITGNDVNHIPRSQFAGFLADFKKAVEAGDFDAEIKAAQESGGSQSGKVTGPRGTDKDPLSGLRKAFGIRMGKLGQSAAEAAAHLRADGKYAVDAIEKVLAEKS